MPVEARFHDGRTAISQTVALTALDGVLAFEAEGSSHRWSLATIVEEPLGSVTRLSCPVDPAARLLVDAADWRALRGPEISEATRRQRHGERRLVAGLAAVGAVILLFVFVIMPALSGPLARATPVAFEERLGDSFDAQLTMPFKLCQKSEGGLSLFKLGQRLERVSGTPFKVQVLLIKAPFANAFALPGGRIMVTDTLIKEARSPDELSAVIAHEVAHVERRHVMQAVWRYFGLGVALDAVVGGGSGAGQQAVLLAGSTTSLRFSRKAEAEADARGMELLQALGLSSKGMAPFFARLASKGDKGALAVFEEFSSDHPDSARRAAAARAAERPGTPAFTPKEWVQIKAACKSTY